MNNSNKRIAAEKRGRRAEIYAALFLQLKGYRILERRFKTKSGEIDLIVRRGRVIAMVEVKQRATMAAAYESLHPAALKRIEQAASHFLNTRRQYDDCEVRYDVIFALPRFRIRHLRDAWRTY